jgi:carbon-monoxide dehydrogenase small subunit
MTDQTDVILELHVNGRNYRVMAPANALLLDVLRNKLGLTGAKRGCDDGSCGACTVLIDGKAVYSCLTLAVEAQGKKIMTIEGLVESGEIEVYKEAFLEADAVQCGYCTPGMVLATKALLDEVDRPNEVQIREGIAGNLCRCTGYVNIVRAIKLVAERKGTVSSR